MVIAHLARRLHRGQAGITLVELLVALSVSVIIVGAVAGFFAAALRATSTNSAADTNTRRSTIVMNVLTRYIHAATVLPKTDGTYAPAITAASGTDVTFYAYVNLTNGTATQPVLVRFYVDANKNIVEQQWDGTVDANGYYSFPDPGSTTPSRVIPLGGPIASPTSDNTTLFSYLDASGAAVTTLNSANFTKIRAIQVNLELGSSRAGAAGNTHIQNTLYLFNVGYSTSTSGGTP